MAADNSAPDAPNDVKAKFAEALKRKHDHEPRGHAERGNGPEPRVHETHGPEGGKRGFTRRKTG